MTNRIWQKKPHKSLEISRELKKKTGFCSFPQQCGKRGHCGEQACLMYEYYPLHDPSFSIHNGVQKAWDHSENLESTWMESHNRVGEVWDIWSMVNCNVLKHARGAQITAFQLKDTVWSWHFSPLCLSHQYWDNIKAKALCQIYGLISLTDPDEHQEKTRTVC